jgi:nicotinate-nucleotide adenylyltransferase
LSSIASDPPKKIGILGGTFDPPHLGHLKLATHFAKCFGLDELLLIPNGTPWQKGVDITSAEIRYQLTEAAAIDLARALVYAQIPTRISLDRMEIERPGPTYAIDTAKALRVRFGGDVSLIWLMGADSFIELPSWNTWQSLLDFVHLAVASRPHHALHTEFGAELQAFKDLHSCKDTNTLVKSPFGRIYIDESLAVDLSSSALRKQLQSGSQALIGSGQIPSHVLELITKLGLYK